jgi:ferredoxin-NADP reductase
MAAEREATLARVVEHDAETRSLFLHLDAPLDFRPGQFISCLLPIGIRPYTIASDPEQASDIEILLNLVPGGPGSHHLFTLRPGAHVRFTGPWGTFVLDRAPDAECVFIADGTGIAPIRPMIHRALATATGRPLRLLAGAASPDAVLYRTELDALAAAHPAFRWEFAASATLEAEVQRRWVDADADRSRHFFICGVGAIVPALRDRLRRSGYERRAVQYEKW